MGDCARHAGGPMQTSLNTLESPWAEAGMSRRDTGGGTHAKGHKDGTQAVGHGRRDTVIGTQAVGHGCVCVGGSQKTRSMTRSIRIPIVLCQKVKAKQSAH